MTDDVNQLEIFSCKQQLVKIVHVNITTLFTLECIDKSGYDCPLFLNSEIQQSRIMVWVKEMDSIIICYV